MTGDFTLSITGGVATIASFDSVARTSDTEWVLAFTTAGIANGSERITVVPASSSSIYDGADNAAAATQSNNNVLLNEKVVPTLSSVSITSNNATPTLAVLNNIVTAHLYCQRNAFGGNGDVFEWWNCYYLQQGHALLTVATLGLLSYSARQY